MFSISFNGYRLVTLRWLLISKQWDGLVERHYAHREVAFAAGNNSQTPSHFLRFEDLNSDRKRMTLVGHTKMFRWHSLLKPNHSIQHQIGFLIHQMLEVCSISRANLHD